MAVYQENIHPLWSPRCNQKRRVKEVPYAHPPKGNKYREEEAMIRTLAICGASRPR